MADCDIAADVVAVEVSGNSDSRARARRVSEAEAVASLASHSVVVMPCASKSQRNVRSLHSMYLKAILTGFQAPSRCRHALFTPDRAKGRTYL